MSSSYRPAGAFGPAGDYYLRSPLQQQAGDLGRDSRSPLQRQADDLASRGRLSRKIKKALKITGFVLWGMITIGAINTAQHAQQASTPAANDSKIVSSYNDGWVDGQKDLQDRWLHGEQSKITQCLKVATPTMITACVDR